MTPQPPSPALARSARFAEVSGLIIQDVRNGCSIDDSAGRYNLHRRTPYRWQRRGLDAKARRDAGEEIGAEDELYIDFAERLIAARYEAKIEAETIFRQHIIGYEEVDVREVMEVRRGPDGRPLLDADGQPLMVVVKRTETRRRRRSERLLLEWLARRYPQEYSPRVVAELTGAGGGPIDIRSRAESLAEQAERYLQAQAEAADEELEAGPAELD